jgi:hypothetical protein
MLNDVYCVADSGSRTMMLQFDLSAAFDTLDTKTLLRLLRSTFGVSGPALNWVSSYLVCRYQSVRVGQMQSSIIDCEHGVPQGSVLGPLLFTLYVSPIANVISSFGVSHTQYADDIQLNCTLLSTTSNQHRRYRAASAQCNTGWNGLSMNPEKTELAITTGTVHDNEPKVLRVRSTSVA